MLARGSFMDQPCLPGVADYVATRCTPVQRIIVEHLEDFLAAGSTQGRRLPRYVEQALRAQLACGIAARGLVQARCRRCGQLSIVALSCRPGCPRCAVRTTRDTAAHLADRVVAERPLRQWVLTVPPRLRLELACDAEVYGALTRIFVDELLRWQGQQATRMRIDGARGGALSFQQRFGDSLNLNCHVHVAAFDGVFTPAPGGGRATFHPLPPPRQLDLEQVVHNTQLRMARWLARRKPPAATDESTGRPSALELCARSALSIGDLRSFREVTGDDQGGPDSASAKAQGRSSAKGRQGYTLHAGVVAAAGNRADRLRLLRYCARPPLQPERVSLLPDGRVVYRLRHRWPSDKTHSVMAPQQFLARLAALVPPPQQPLLRYHGVLAPRAHLRPAVVPERRRAKQLALCAEQLRPGGGRPASGPRVGSVRRPVAAASSPRQASEQRPAVEQGVDRRPTARPAGQVEHQQQPVVDPPHVQTATNPLEANAQAGPEPEHETVAIACPCGGTLEVIDETDESPRRRWEARSASATI